MFAWITKVNEGESITPCPSTLEVTYSSVENLVVVVPFNPGTPIDIQEQGVMVSHPTRQLR
jgi:hypothetical protein